MGTEFSGPDRILGGKIRMLIEDISGANNMSMCEASGIVAQVLMEPEIFSKIEKALEVPNPKDVLTRLIENNVLAACTLDNEYMFRE